MRDPHKPFHSWGLVIILWVIAIVLCVADSWNDVSADPSETQTTQQVLR